VPDAVLMMTGDSLEQSYVDAIEAGADDFLPKPLALPELRAGPIGDAHEAVYR
jgi:DNA-binding response OmpR family regulator